MDRAPHSSEDRSLPALFQDGNGREDGDVKMSQEAVDGYDTRRGGSSRYDEDRTSYWASRRDDSGDLVSGASAGAGASGGGMISPDDTSMNFASPTHSNVSMRPYSGSNPHYSSYSTSTTNLSNNYPPNNSSTTSQPYARPERVPGRLKTFPSSTSTTSSSQPAPSSPTSPFPNVAQSPDPSRRFPPSSDRHGPMPPLTLMNPLRTQSTDGWGNYQDAYGSSAGQVPPPVAASSQFLPPDRTSSPPPIHQVPAFPRPSGLFLPPNPYPASSYNQSRRHGDPSAVFPLAPPVVEFAASRTAEPGPGPRSASALRRGSLNTVNSGMRKADGQEKYSRARADGMDDGTERPREDAGIISLGPVGREGWQLSVVQQPERARLCSFKEENETIDRRPVDPPPVVKLTRTGHTVEEMVVASVRLRAIVVSATPTITRKSLDQPEPHDYEERRLAQGADATTGETTQGLDQLQDLAGHMGAFAVFGKLSVRVPGVFRLRFELFETISGQERGLAACVSEPFEVFSPKQFKGMKESTALTRHFASQGFKIKLRQDAGAGRGGRKRKAADGNSIVDGNRRSTARPRKLVDEGSGTMVTSSSRSGVNDPDGLDGVRLQKMRIEPLPSRRSSSMAGSAMGRQDGAEDYMNGYMDGTNDDTTAMYDGEPSRSTSRADGKVSLPPIGKVLKQSSIWFNESGLPVDAGPGAAADGDEDVRLVGGVAFEDGIRYGGDDGGLPPMSFGRLPSMISEGILPTTPGGFLGPSDPANFSLKGLSSRFAAPVNSHNNNPIGPFADQVYDRMDGAGLRPSGMAIRSSLNAFGSHPPPPMHPWAQAHDDRQAFSSEVPNKAFKLAIPISRKVEDDGEGPPMPFRTI